MTDVLAFPLGARFVLICLASPSVLISYAMLGGKYLLDQDSWLVVNSLLALWVIGSVWILAGRATERNGWGQLKVSEAIFFPLATFSAVVAPIFLVAVIGIGHMH